MKIPPNPVRLAMGCKGRRQENLNYSTFNTNTREWWGYWDDHHSVEYVTAVSTYYRINRSAWGTPVSDLLRPGSMWGAGL